MAGKKLSRREMLKMLGTGAVGTFVLAACTQQPAPAAPEAEAPTVSEAEVPAPPPEPATLVWWRWGGTEQSERQDTALRRVYPELNERSSMEFIVAGGGDFEVAEAFRLALASGQDIPDLVRFNRTQVSEFARAGELLVLNEVYNPYKDDLYAGALALVQEEGDFIAFPRTLKSKMFYYRADLFEEAGINAGDIKTKNDFINAGKTLNEKFPESYILNLGPQPNQYWTHEILSAYDGVRMADEAGNYLLTEQQGFADMFTFLKEVFDSGISLPIDDWSADWQQAFADEAITGSLLANWMKRFLPSFAPEQGGLWQVSLWPALDPLADQSYGSEAGGAVLVVPKRSENHEFAVDYAAKLTLDKEGAMALFEAEGQTPLMKSAQDDVLAAVREGKKPAEISDEEWALHPTVYFGPEFQEVEFQSYETVKVFPFDPSATREIEILVDWLHRYMADEVELGEALAGAQEDMEVQIGNPYEI